MDKFQDAYRDAAEALPAFRLEAGKARDELHHYKMKRRNRNYRIVKGCTAASVFLLCGVGTAAAKSYRDSVIRVNDTGVVITAQEQEDAPDLFSLFKQLGGVFSITEAGPEALSEDTCEIETVEYDSLGEFLAKEDIAVAIPDRSLFGAGFTSERVSVADGGRDVTIQLYNDKASFCLTQFDNREVSSYSTAMTFGGHSVNERRFTNRQGLNYVIFDTEDDKNKVISSCAVISVNGWDLTLTFRGFDKRTMEKIINSIDLSIYFK